MRLDEWKILAFCIAALIMLLCAWWALLTDGGVQKPIRNTYYPFTVEVEIWDIGASPWDHRDRPTDLDK